MTEPYGQNLRNRHQHSEQGHAAQQLTKQWAVVSIVGVVGFGNIVISKLRGKITAACDSMDFIVFLLSRIPS